MLRFNMQQLTNHILTVNEFNWNDVFNNEHQSPFRISEIVSLQKSQRLPSVAFKYNMQGQEVYYNKKSEQIIGEGEFLLAINQGYCEVNVQQLHQPDLGICVDINIDLLEDGLSALFQPNHFDAQCAKNNYFLEDDLFIKFTSDDLFKQYLHQLFYKIKNNPVVCMPELECAFIDHFLQHQQPFLNFYHQIPVLKNSTRKIIFEKMLTAKQHIESCLFCNINICAIAQSVFLSEFRFYHLFKQTYGISPYQYLIQLRLAKACQMYSLGKQTWTEIAKQLQFSNIQSFSKLFKNFYKISPSRFALSRH
jgi:AraC family transcriptional regulator